MFGSAQGHLVTVTLCVLLGASTGYSAEPNGTAPAPLFFDPFTDGVKDPTIIYNRAEGEWWILYTQLRANLALPGQGGSRGGVVTIYGTDIAVASSVDGQQWTYRGLLDLQAEPGRNTYWAPDVVFDPSTREYHLFCGYIRGVHTTFSNNKSVIHFTAPDLWGPWKFSGVVPLNSSSVIDPALWHMPDGSWRLWYKDETRGSHTWVAQSSDLSTWTVLGCAIDGDPHEAPYVVAWGAGYIMIVDYWKGLGVFTSPDANTWDYQGIILGGAGTRTEDSASGGHGSLLVQEGRCYVFYHCFPQDGAGAAVAQAAVLTRSDSGAAPNCTRDLPFEFWLLPGEGSK